MSPTVDFDGVDPLGSSPEDFAAMIAADISLWAQAFKVAGVREWREVANGLRRASPPIPLPQSERALQSLIRVTIFR
jgi:hypothetical protein